MQCYTLESNHNKKQVQKNARRPLLYVAVTNTRTSLCLQCMTSSKNSDSSKDNVSITASTSSLQNTFPNTEWNFSSHSSLEHTCEAAVTLMWQDS